MEFYAQYYEDVIINYMLEDVDEPIFYIDVGANDPTKLSVTKHFYIQGGHGINIEPYTKLFNKLKEERSRDINLNYAVSNASGFHEMSFSDQEMFYNSDYDYFNSVKNTEKKLVECKTLTQICDEYLPIDQVIHFLKVDIDGFEKECLEGMDFKKYRPWIICIEISVSDEWMGYLYDADYILIYRDVLNAYLVAKELFDQGKFSMCLRNDLAKYCCKRYDIEIIDGKQISKENKQQSVSSMLNQMFWLRQNGQTLKPYFEERNYKEIAIYGMSYVGERLYMELRDSGIEVAYAIDKNARNLCGEIDIVLPDDELKTVDAIIVTPVYSFKDIHAVLHGKVDCPIISLEDIIYKL